MSLKEIKTFHESLNAIASEVKTGRAILEIFKTKALTPEEEQEYLNLNRPLN